ncbi:MAG: 3-deoxy-D-manno-octulosonic acid transferase [Alphaproteobacteria bacterium]|nr:3-deoxy-D-manno-octulosonic acid transferase [Alphaproteobacteria bacterium]
MPAARLPYLAYGALGIAITPALRLWLARRVRRGKEDATRLAERFGYARTPRPEGTLLWLHAASVGETQSVLTLVRALLAAHPHLHLLITTGTVTSAALVAQQNLPRVLHQFVPVDTYPAVRRFLNHWQPDVALWVESEFWPQLLWQAQARHLPMLLVNARLSQKTFENWRRWPHIIRSMLHTFCSIYAGSAEDAARLTALGGSNIREVGNLKYDAAPLPVEEAMLQQFAQQSEGRRIFLAASTHANEEQQIAYTHTIAAQQFPTLLTVIVPRHAARGDAIAADLRSCGFSVAQRSKNEPITTTTALYLADTMGELGLFYRCAEIVFMGGSLVAHGGQNPLEAARFNNAILTGPHTHNFAPIVARFAAADAMRIVADKAALATTLVALLGDDAARTSLAHNAQEAVNHAGRALPHIVQQCSSLIARSSR